MSEPWYQFCLKEIDQRINSGRKRLREKDREFLDSIRPKIAAGMFLSPGGEKWLRDIHARVTELSRIKW